MKLELKHLDFVNNGKVKLSRLPHFEFKEVNLQDCILAFNPTDKEPFLRYKDVTFGLNQVTLYKRPLSSLVKEIEHNGETFVPIDVLNKNGFTKYSLKHINFVPYLLAEFIAEYNILSPNCAKDKLYEWHFDIHGLIEKGLAIEKQ